MNIGLLKSRKAVVGISAAVVLAAGGATALAVTSGDSTSDHVTGTERDRVAAAAVNLVPGTVVKVEHEDEDDGHRDSGYDVTVRSADGTITELELSKDLEIVGTKVDSDVAKLTPEQQAALETAVATVVPDGKVIEVETTSDHGAAYEAKVEVIRGQTVTDHEVYLDTTFKVVHHEQD